VPPTPNELIDFFALNGSSKKEAGLYFNHYTANGWKVGKNPMRDWQAAARGWIGRGPLMNGAPILEEKPRRFLQAPEGLDAPRDRNAEFLARRAAEAEGEKPP